MAVGVAAATWCGSAVAVEPADNDFSGRETILPLGSGTLPGSLEGSPALVGFTIGWSPLDGAPPFPWYWTAPDTIYTRQLDIGPGGWPPNPDGSFPLWFSAWYDTNFDGIDDNPPFLPHTVSGEFEIYFDVVGAGWAEPCILWTAIVGESGTHKSPALEKALAFVQRREGIEAQRYEEAMQIHADELARYERSRDAWRKSKQSDPPQKPVEPVRKRLLCLDATVEALATILADNPHGVLVARDELNAWLGSFNAYNSGRSDAASWLEMHRGNPLTVDRKGGERRTIHVPRASVSLTGGIQPAVLRKALGRDHFDNGLAARFLLAMPPRRPRRWTDDELPVEAEQAMGRVFDQLWSLCGVSGGSADAEPIALAFSPDGKAAWVEFYNKHGSEQSGLSGDLAAAWSKLEGYAARLALLVHLCRWAQDDATLADPDRVDRASVAAAVELVCWFKHETERLYRVLGETEADQEQRRLVEFIQRNGGAVTVRDTQRAMSFPTADDARAALDELAGAGIGFWEAPEAGPGRPSQRFRLGAASAGADDGTDTTDTDRTPDSVALRRVLSVSVPSAASRRDAIPAGTPVRSVEESADTAGKAAEREVETAATTR